MWIRLPSTSERNVLFAKFTSKGGDGQWTTHITYNWKSVEACRPDIRSRRFMMTQLIKLSAKFAARNNIHKKAIKG